MYGYGTPYILKTSNVPTPCMSPAGRMSDVTEHFSKYLGKERPQQDYLTARGNFAIVLTYKVIEAEYVVIPMTLLLFRISQQVKVVCAIVKALVGGGVYILST